MFEYFGKSWSLIRPPVCFRVLAMLLLAVCPLSAQYRIDHWTADTGLPQNSVYAIRQTHDGYLWFATVDGLVRFDGVRFTIFNLSNSPGITSNRFISLLEDQKGDLWAGTEENGVTRLRNGRFENFNRENGLNTSFAYLMSSDADGNPVVHGPEFSLTHFNGEKFVPYQPESGQGTSRSDATGQYVNCQSDESAADLRCLRRSGWFNVKNPDNRTYLDFIQTRAAEAEDGSLWVAFRQGEVQKFDAAGNVKIYRENAELPGRALILVPGADRIRLLSRDVQGAVWLTDLTTMKSEPVTREPSESFVDLTYAYEDSEGSIWVGTLRGGLFRLRKQIIKGYSKAEGLADNNVYPIYQDRQGTIWAGATGLYRNADGRFELVKGTEGFQVQALAETLDGRLLFSLYGAKNSGIYELNRGQVKLFYEPQQLTLAIYADNDGAVWIGGYYGLIRLKDGQATTVLDETDVLSGRDVRIIIGDGAGGLWIGGYGALNHYRDGTLQRWLPGEELPMQTIRSLYLDSDGVLWIGSYDNGLARFRDGKFTHYRSQNGLFNDGAFQILEDDQRNFWLCSNRGIYRVRKDELNEFADGKRGSITSIVYGKSDGMMSAECNGGRAPAGIRARDGQLWFPTQDGVAVVDPQKIRTNSKPPPVIIEDIKIDNESVGFAAVRSALSDSAPAVRIEPNRQNFEIQYTALSFINSENIRFKYRLEGLDSDWVDAGTRRTAYFSHVAPGDYTFRVIAANSDGVWNETGQSLKVTVLPPFYRTWWFVLLSALTALTLGYLALRRRIVQIERQRLAQQTFSRQLIAAQEAERKRIAAELHDSLGQRLVIIKNLAWIFLSANKDKEQSQIEEISTEASQAISEVKAISYNLRPYQLDRIGLTKAIEGLIRSARGASDIGFVLEMDNIDDYFAKDLEINFYRIIQESVNNILKHSGATMAEIGIVRGTGTLDIVISDNGRGFQIDENAANPKSKIQNPKSDGFGLIGIRERTELLGGKMEIKSAPNEGTRIFIRLEGS